MTKQAKYLKAWRKAHPGYHSTWTRRERAKRKPGKTVRILGVVVYLGRMA